MLFFRLSWVVLERPASFPVERGVGGCADRSFDSPSPALPLARCARWGGSVWAFRKLDGLQQHGLKSVHQAETLKETHPKDPCHASP